MMSIDVYWVTSDGMDDMRPTPDQSGPISNLRSECCDKVLNQRHLAKPILLQTFHFDMIIESRKGLLFGVDRSRNKWYNSW